MNINRVVLTGNLTRDPDTRSTPGGLSICKLGIAVNTRRKNADGQWEEKPNFFRVTVFGRQAESCGQYLKKGRPVAIDGRLEWSQWEDPNGQKRESVDIIADTVQFLGGREDAGGGGNGFSSGVRPTDSDIPIDDSDFETASVGAAASDDDIPF